jgi:hypothetical protein
MKTKTRRNRITRKKQYKRKGGSRINRNNARITISYPLTERQRVTQRIQQYISDFSALPDGNERLNIITEMFNYIHDNANIILAGYPRFRQTVRDKISEVRNKMQSNNSVRRNIIGLEDITNKLDQLINDIDYNESHP